ncbi:hypothetical protein GOBAR_AA13669 [Gossypium barbadense]|uniref:Uncharacterized protein n=1 Tax=Gossypium barbadense TaxID=3634 RepID=A0A2P5XUE5_GOSBA|nr:hypothetical protein GOBAR_AA13669 [Gossypium barbadense]
MGKKQHSKDRMFITKTEWATEWGGAKSKENRTPFKRLPFYCCALTFTPFELPVCTKDGSVFDLMLECSSLYKKVWEASGYWGSIEAGGSYQSYFPQEL